MRLKRLFILFCMVIFLFSFYINKEQTFASNKTDLFNEIIEGTFSSVVEYGLSVSFEIKESELKNIKENDEENILYSNLIKKLQLDKEENFKVEKGNVNNVSFENKSGSGYIRTTNYNNNKFIVISIDKFDKINRIDELELSVKNSINPKYSNLKFFKYVKAKLPKEDLNNPKEQVFNILTKEKATYLNYIKINNGYSINAYTKRYELIKSGNEFMDFQCVLSKYNSGNYMIIGSPEILINY